MISLESDRKASSTGGVDDFSVSCHMVKAISEERLLPVNIVVYILCTIGVKGRFRREDSKLPFI